MEEREADRTLHSYATQMLNILRHGYRQIGEVPIILGETGCPFDLNDKAAFRSKDFRWQERMLDGICSAIGDSGLSNFKYVVPVCRERIPRRHFR